MMMLAVVPVSPLLTIDDISSDEEDEATPRQSMSHEAMVSLNEMRLNNQFCDVAVKMDCGTVFNLHRAIMCACSDYFK